MKATQQLRKAIEHANVAVCRLCKATIQQRCLTQHAHAIMLGHCAAVAHMPFSESDAWHASSVMHRVLHTHQQQESNESMPLAQCARTGSSLHQLQLSPPPPPVMLTALLLQLALPTHPPCLRLPLLLNSMHHPPCLRPSLLRHPVCHPLWLMSPLSSPQAPPQVCICPCKKPSAEAATLVTNSQALPVHHPAVPLSPCSLM
jgi:hypothetical protein